MVIKNQIFLIFLVYPYSKWEFNPYKETKDFKFQISTDCLEILLNSEWTNKKMTDLNLYSKNLSKFFEIYC